MSKITASFSFDQVKPEEMPRYLTLFGDQVVRTVNGGLDFQTNFNGTVVSLTFSATNTDTSVAHGLGRVPTGYLIIGRTANMGIYNGAASNTATNLILRSSSVGTASVLVF